jgi:hypothetical protein
MSELRTITLHGLNDGSPVSVELQVDKGCQLFLNTAEGDVSISEIPTELEWNLKTVDVNNTTYISPHVGGRPNDRK